MSRLQDALSVWEEDFPNFYTFVSNEDNIKEMEDGTHTSDRFDKKSHTLYNKYINVQDGKIVALGENYPREGGWYWFDKDKN